ncbi:hypothetical protein [Virgibacillus ndiopensis]
MVYLIRNSIKYIPSNDYKSFTKAVNALEK